MAAAPVKSPLHNFPLTFLKWGSKKDHRCRRSPYDTPSPPPPPPPDAEPSHSKGSRSSRNRRNNNHNQNHPPTPPPLLPTTTTTTAPDDDDEERDCGKKREVAEEGDGGEDGSEKGWNLRPRRAAAMKGTSSTTTNTNYNIHTPTMVDGAGDNLPKSMRLRGSETQVYGGTYGGGGSERRETKRFWISLSRDEIEEDIYSMTHSKPSRRPKKRPKNVQKQVDNVFPGLWMVGFSPESYRGIDVLPKR
ncbi:hypothetical protein SOVF_025670 [Spinacia oleracea]|uniref:Uncharacterized protein isoform X1 n=1 Tax=Spinacia oleracea TaxID=3562 RepID=A0A9R0IV85_SPIOL|nr:uncharacterized protein LOC110795479 isoform X1 [Spinacia oleracea]KNA23342.1 hypothetical protein SOVF_025670 [Spinacia oleracea]